MAELLSQSQTNRALFGKWIDSRFVSDCRLVVDSQIPCKFVVNGSHVRESVLETLHSDEGQRDGKQRTQSYAQLPTIRLPVWPCHVTAAGRCAFAAPQTSESQ